MRSRIAASLLAAVLEVSLASLVGLGIGAPVAAGAHEEGAPFSGAIIDPPVLHHAHIENEQRLNFAFLRGVRDPAGRKRSGYEGELELAYGSKNFRYGFELFVPFSSLPASGEDRVTGVGDIEVRPLKYALYMAPDAVISTATAVVLPTGSESRGLGSGNTSLSQLLFADKALGNWGAGLNVGVGSNVSGEEATWFEFGLGMSYSFIRGVRFGELAPARPAQKWVLSPSVEFIGEKLLRGEESGTPSMSVIPGLTLWHPDTGWQIRTGIAFPTSGAREADRELFVQLGNHLNWGGLFR